MLLDGSVFDSCVGGQVFIVDAQVPFAVARLAITASRVAQKGASSRLVLRN